jgi:hypothetical protein
LHDDDLAVVYKTTPVEQSKHLLTASKQICLESTEKTSSDKSIMIILIWESSWILQ